MHLTLSVFNRYFKETTWTLGLLSLVFLSLGGYLVFYSPDDYLQGVYAKIMYVHVPCAWLSSLLYVLLAGFSALYLALRNPLYEIFAKAIAPVGMCVTLITLITGAIWGQPTWGTWWVWDARLTSMLVLLFIYFGYLALRSNFHNELKAARISSIFAIVGLINIPIIKFSVDLWNTLHQPSSVFKLSGPTIHSSMLYPLLSMSLAILFMSCLLVLLRVQTEACNRKIDSYKFK